MTKSMVCNSILNYLLACKPIEVKDKDASIFSGDKQFEARDLTYLCLRMKEQYGCDLNQAVRKIKVCSVNELTEAFWLSMP